MFWGMVTAGVVLAMGLVLTVTMVVVSWWFRKPDEPVKNGPGPVAAGRTFGRAEDAPRVANDPPQDANPPQRVPAYGSNAPPQHFQRPAGPPSAIVAPPNANAPQQGGDAQARPPYPMTPGYGSGPMPRFQPPPESLPQGIRPGFPYQPPGVQPPGGQPNGPFLAGQDAFAGWLQDLEVAKADAASQRKDILVLFTGSDWCGWSQKLAKEVLSQPLFQTRAGESFVFVFVDFPRTEQGKAKVQNLVRNARLQEEFDVRGYPTVVLTDARGQPYAKEGYKEGGANKYLDRLAELQKRREQRDRLLEAVTAARGADKLQAAKEALKFLGENDLVGFYGSLLSEWLELARKFDAKNERGFNECFFEVDWLMQVVRSDSKDANRLVERVGLLADWKKRCKFKDANRGARLHLIAAKLLYNADKDEEAVKYLQEALAYKPTNPDLVRAIRKGLDSLGKGSGETRMAQGTGFVVASGGYIMTNRHVVEGAAQLFVRLEKIEKPVAAELVDKHPTRDIALIRIKVPKGVTLKPLPVAGKRQASRGQQVAAFGYPLGNTFGSGIKLTTGVISATPEAGTHDMYMLDARINPGNSGGPICDSSGSVLGMVTAKSFIEENIDSYGMAIPATELEAFLKKTLPTYKPRAANQKKMPWDEVDRLVSPSVLMVLNKRK